MKISNKLNWIDYNQYIEILVPKEFSFDECLVYLDRSDLECLHKVKNKEIYKLIKYKNELVIIKISAVSSQPSGNTKLAVSFLNGIPKEETRGYIAQYVWDMFDLGTDLSMFYASVKDELFKQLINKYYGLRIIKINDLFEGLAWAIIGQQINLKFAYTLKKRFTESFGERLNFEGEDYWIFPEPEAIEKLDIDSLRELQFTGRKSEYVIGLAQEFVNKKISYEELKQLKYEDIHKRLTAIRGIGSWTADYTILKCFNVYNALPIADAGLHNALKNILKRDKKPSIAEIEAMAKAWRGWESYVTFYLWRSLYA